MILVVLLLLTTLLLPTGITWAEQGHLLPQPVAAELTLSWQPDPSEPALSVRLQPYQLLSEDFSRAPWTDPRITQALSQSQSYRGHIKGVPNTQVAAVLCNNRLYGVVQSGNHGSDAAEWHFTASVSQQQSVAAETLAEVIEADIFSHAQLSNSREPMLQQTAAAIQDQPLSQLQSPARLYIPRLESGFHTYQQPLTAYLPDAVLQQQADGSLALAMAHLMLQINRLDLSISRFALKQYRLSSVVIGSPQAITPEQWLTDFRLQSRQQRLPGDQLLITSLASDAEFSRISHATGAQPVFQLTDAGAPLSSRLPANFSYRPGDRLSSSVVRYLLQRGERDLLRSPAVSWPLAPTAQDNHLLTRQHSPATVDVLSNDFDANGQSLSIADFDAVSQAGGRISQRKDGLLLYQPADGFSGKDSFRYTVMDDNGMSDSATVWITVKSNELVSRHPSQVLDPVDDSYTVAFWFRLPEATETGADVIPLIGKGDTAAHQGWSIALAGDQLRLRLNYQDWDLLGTDWRDPRNQLLLPLGEPANDGWYHLVMSIDRDRGLLTARLNNQAATTQARLPRSGGVITSPQPFRQHPAAEISGLEIRHRTLTDNEITAHFLRPPHLR